MTDYISDERIDELVETTDSCNRSVVRKAIKQAIKEAEPAIRADQMRKDADWLEHNYNNMSAGMYVRPDERYADEVLVDRFLVKAIFKVRANQLRAKSEQ